MARHFDDELQDLRQEIIRMGAIVQEGIFKSIEALKNRDKARAQEVIEADAGVDRLELAIDEKCIDLIARYQPMAGDLRFITMTMKINADLERISDLAVDISQRVLELLDKPVLKPLIDIPKLSLVAQKMVKDVIDSFVNADAGLARKVIATDPEADRLRNSIQRELIQDYMSKDPATVDRAVPLLLIGRYLERMCDHATNIAEDVVYMAEGVVVKHQQDSL